MCSQDWTQGDGGDGSWAESDDSSTTPSGPAREIDPIRGPRDAYLRPMIDARGIRQRLAFKSQVYPHPRIFALCMHSAYHLPRIDCMDPQDKVVV